MSWTSISGPHSALLLEGAEGEQRGAESELCILIISLQGTRN